MISVTKLRNGVTFEENNRPYRVIKYEHTHISRGSGTIKVKVRNLENGSVRTLRYKSGATVEDIEVDKRMLQYLYASGDELIFMDPRSFEQISLSKEVSVGEEKYLIEGEEVNVLFWGQDRILGVDLPPNLIYEVGQTDPGEKGNSATNVYKPATMSNGLVVKVPLFIKIGDKVKVDTRSGEYVERVQ